jgi:hypothetical protein
MTIAATIDEHLEIGCDTHNILTFAELYEWLYMMIDSTEGACEQAICHYDSCGPELIVL